MKHRTRRSDYPIFCAIALPVAEKRKMLQIYLKRATGIAPQDVFCSEPKLKKSYVSGLYRGAYAYFVSIFDLNMYEAMYKDFDVILSQIFKYKSQFIRAIEMEDANHPKAVLAKEIHDRMNRQLRNPHAVLTFPSIESVNYFRTKREPSIRPKEPVNISHTEIKYKTECGYVDALGNIILYPPAKEKWMY